MNFPQITPARKYWKNKVEPGSLVYGLGIHSGNPYLGEALTHTDPEGEVKIEVYGLAVRSVYIEDYINLSPFQGILLDV